MELPSNSLYCKCKECNFDFKYIMYVNFNINVDVISFGFVWKCPNGHINTKINLASKTMLNDVKNETIPI